MGFSLLKIGVVGVTVFQLGVSVRATTIDRSSWEGFGTLYY